MNIDLQDFAAIVGVTTILTTASTYVIVATVCGKLKSDFCEKIEDLAIRLGVIERTEGHSQKDL